MAQCQWHVSVYKSDRAAAMAEEEVSYTSVVFKPNKNPPHQGKFSLLNIKKRYQSYDMDQMLLLCLCDHPHMKCYQTEQRLELLLTRVLSSKFTFLVQCR